MMATHNDSYGNNAGRVRPWRAFGLALAQLVLALGLLVKAAPSIAGTSARKC